MKLFVEDLNKFGNLEYSMHMPQNDKDRFNRFYDECEKLANFVNKHNYIFDYYDAKLHDVFYEFDNVDDFFLEDRWELFDEYVKEKDCKLDYIGRTSSFRVKNDFIDSLYDAVYDRISAGRRGMSDLVVKASDIAYAIAETYYNDGWSVTVFDSDEELNDYIVDRIRTDDFTLDDIDDVVDGIMYDDSAFTIPLQTDEGEYNAARKSIQDVIDVCDYIISFKKNQVEIYRDYIEANQFDDDFDEE